MPGERAATVLRGRSEERRALDRLLKGARAGRSAALVLRGEAGVGKTALLDYVAERASGCGLARVAGVEAEMGFAFAGLLRLFGGAMLERAEQLPAPQRDALRRAFGLIDGPAPETFLVSLAALNLLCQVAEERPLVCLVDDAQWLDRESASALSFVARRIAAEGVAMAFAVREPSAEHELDGLPELVLEGLGDADARLLLDAAVPGGLDEEIRERIVTETRGNPLALLELTRGLTPAELAGGFGLPDERELSGRIEQTFLRRVQALAPQTQIALLVAAAEAVGDTTVIAQAAGRLGVGPTDLIAAEDADLVALGPRVRFRHPLVRSAAYRAATPNERRQAHDSLPARAGSSRTPCRRRGPSSYPPDPPVGEDQGIPRTRRMSSNATLLPAQRKGADSMNTHSTITRRELASRSIDGLDVTLVWSKRDGKDEVVVSVTDHREGAYFEIPAEPAHALKVYNHPFAFRDLSTIDYEDTRLAA